MNNFCYLNWFCLVFFFYIDWVFKIFVIIGKFVSIVGVREKIIILLKMT